MTADWKALWPRPELRSRPVALVIGPWRDRTEWDEERMEEALERLAEGGFAPLFYPTSLDVVLNDACHAERAVALECSDGVVRALARAPGTVAFLDRAVPLSEGMARDLAAWMDERGGGPPLELPVGDGAEATLEQAWELVQATRPGRRGRGNRVWEGFRRELRRAEGRRP